MELATPTPRPARTPTKRCIYVSAEQVSGMVARYKAGATVYDLAEEFGINRRTVSHRLKQAGIPLRRQPPTPDCIADMIRLYESGQSLAKVGGVVGFAAQTVANHLTAAGIVLRDPHGRERS
ncbi:helix-turn-helix domain containing protein [Tsukamurella tyrosinosolvens]|uniref:hypothetical protein n=1 Tax=Tsukamurella tyrosinosolvens TaxID=57704 RepID=UPI001CE04CAD|nr:hypothetical protein [Tsukamurella tyrosinosolvens]MCA4997286.1 helix-turn-helix domain containing protein [Tsukamurella tyrosinosolvens]